MPGGSTHEQQRCQTCSNFAREVGILSVELRRIELDILVSVKSLGVDTRYCESGKAG